MIGTSIPTTQGGRRRRPAHRGVARTSVGWGWSSRWLATDYEAREWGRTPGSGLANKHASERRTGASGRERFCSGRGAAGGPDSVECRWDTWMLIGAVRSLSGMRLDHLVRIRTRFGGRNASSILDCAKSQEPGWSFLRKSKPVPRRRTRPTQMQLLLLRRRVWSSGYSSRHIVCTMPQPATQPADAARSPIKSAPSPVRITPPSEHSSSPNPHPQASGTAVAPRSRKERGAMSWRPALVRSTRRCFGLSDQQVVHDVAGDVGESEVSTHVPVG